MRILCTLVVLLASVAWAQPNSAKTMTSGKALSPKAFLDKASEVNRSEIQLGELAQKNASNSLVKQDGQRMITDHTRLEDQVKALASKMDVTLPSTLSAQDREDYRALSPKTGAAFDRSYVEAMVAGHKAVIAEFEREINTTTNADIKTLAQDALPTLQEHLHIWESAAKQLGYPITSTTGGMH